MRYLVIAIVVLVAVAASIAGASLIVVSLVPDEPSSQEQPAYARAYPKGQAPKNPQPLVHLKGDELHDFGYLDPWQRGEVAFTIQNKGDGPLKLSPPKTSCGCTEAVLLDGDEIAPGETGRLRATWKTGRVGPFYQTVDILTNDPLKRTLRVGVRGLIRSHVAAQPGALSFPKQAPGTPATASVLVYSDVYDDFQIKEVHTPQEGFEWKVEPAETSELSSDAVRKAYRIVGVSNGEKSQGAYHGELEVTIDTGVEGEEPQSLFIPFQGKILRRLAVYGPTIDASGEIDMQTTYEGRAKSVSLVVKVSDPDKVLPNIELKTKPEFINARLTPFAAANAKPGLYNLTVEIPADAPPCSYLGKDRGELVISSDHVRVPATTLYLRFAVYEKAIAGTSQ